MSCCDRPAGRPLAFWFLGFTRVEDNSRSSWRNCLTGSPELRDVRGLLGQRDHRLRQLLQPVEPLLGGVVGRAVGMNERVALPVQPVLHRPVEARELRQHHVRQPTRGVGADTERGVVPDPQDALAAVGRVAAEVEERQMVRAGRVEAVRLEPVLLGLVGVGDQRGQDGMVGREHRRQEPHRVEAPRHERRPVNDRLAQQRPEVRVLAVGALHVTRQGVHRRGVTEPAGGLFDGLGGQADDAALHQRVLLHRPAEHHRLRERLERGAVEVLEDRVGGDVVQVAHLLEPGRLAKRRQALGDRVAGEVLGERLALAGELLHHLADLPGGTARSSSALPEPGCWRSISCSTLRARR
jgi:hypothetical protein